MLKNCPFCGSKNITIEKWIGYYARCNKCGCCFPDCDSKKLASKIWNTRHSEVKNVKSQ